jgi:hypothetical protein
MGHSHPDKDHDVKEVNAFDVENFRRNRKIIRLAEFQENPQAVLASTLEKSEFIESVVVLIKWKKTKSYVVDHSSLQYTDLLMFEKALGMYTNQAIWDVSECEECRAIHDGIKDGEC